MKASDESVTKLNWEHLSKLGTWCTASQGQMILRQGDAGATVIFLVEGHVEIWAEEFHIEREAPMVLGEMAMFNQGTRTATVRTLTGAKWLEIDVETLRQAVYEQDADALKLMRYIGSVVMERMHWTELQLKEQAKSPKASTFAQLKNTLSRNWSLEFHSLGQPGKLAVVSTKNIGSAEELAVAYSPGVAEPCKVIQDAPEEAYNLTTKGNLVGVVTNGSAVLGLGNIGALASKPVMEGKAVLFKLFSGVDAFDIEVDEANPEKFIETVARLEPTFGGINLEDIKAPECFYIERSLKERMNIPVFHDDQHGTAIIVGAGLQNALELVNKRIEDIKVIFSGAGAGGSACARYLIQLGVQAQHLYMYDVEGFISAERGAALEIADLCTHQQAGSMAEELVDADLFCGLSAGGVLRPEMLKSMAKNPIVFALANPNPEIDYNTAMETRSDAIVATGRSDYPNQINNVMAFPYIFRGALDIQARRISEGMKLSATEALRQLGVDDEAFGREHLIPKPFDPRLLVTVSTTVAKTAIEEGLARRVFGIDFYKRRLRKLRDRLHLVSEG